MQLDVIKGRKLHNKTRVGGSSKRIPTNHRQLGGVWEAPVLAKGIRDTDFPPSVRVSSCVYRHKVR